MANIRFRKACVRLGCSSPSHAEDLRAICSRDPLFWMNVFGYVFEPRTGQVLPFITYPFQDDAIAEIYDAIGNHDLVTEKSRDMGATWIHLFTFFHRFKFREDETFLLLSRKEELVEKRGDPKALFSKLEFIHKWEPGWLKSPIERGKMHMLNSETGCTIDGESTNEFAGVADRRTAILLDEFSKMKDQGNILRGTRDVTFSRLFNFTPQGTGNASFAIAHNPEFRKVTLHWSSHPVKARGSYRGADGRIRSPWYDRECKRAATPQEIAQELDIDYQGTEYAFFDVRMLEVLKGRDVRPPYMVGDLRHDKLTGWEDGFHESENGSFRLWCSLGADGFPPTDRSYVVGADIAFGTSDSTGRGASNSVLSVVDRETGEKVAEFASSTIDPTDFAALAVATARWFGSPGEEGALLIWEANGPGRLFGKRVIDLGYGHIWYRRSEDSRNRSETQFPGWWSTDETKSILLGEYRRTLKEGLFVNRSEHALREAGEYIVSATGKIGHCRSFGADDPTRARENHGDRVIADALCSMVLVECRVPVPEVAEEIPVSCIARRKQEYEAAVLVLIGDEAGWD